MNVRAGSYSRHRSPKREIRNTLALQITNERFSLDAIRMQRHVDRVAMVIAETVVSR